MAAKTVKPSAKWEDVPGLFDDPTLFDIPAIDWDSGDWFTTPEWGDGAPPPTSGDFGGVDVPSGDGDGGGFSMPSWITSALSQLGRLTGVTGGQGGGPNLAALLPLIAGIGGGVTANNATNRATDAMLASNREAVDYLRGQQATSGAGFQPYRDAGAASLGQLASMGPSNLSARYRPLGSGRGIVGGMGSAPQGGSTLGGILAALGGPSAAQPAGWGSAPMDLKRAQR